MGCLDIRAMAGRLSRRGEPLHRLINAGSGSAIEADYTE